MADWFCPNPYDYSETRVTLDFGLSAATRYYNDLIVPKIGSVRSLRSFSYALAGIKLYSELDIRESPTRIAHGIEAIANKIYWSNGEGSENFGVLGINGFKKHPDEWRYFSILENYVKSNTMRQSTVSALKNFQLVNGSNYNSFNLEESGKVIADLFLSIDNVGIHLSEWIKGKKIDIKQLSVITLDCITKDEINQFLGFLKTEDFDGNTRRKNLWELLEKGKSYNELTDYKHIADIKLVEAFEVLKCEIINFYLEIAEKNLTKKISEIKISKERLLTAISDYEEQQIKSRQSHSEIESILRKIKNKETSELIEELMIIERDLISIDENKKIQKGLFYREDRIKSLKRETSVNELPRLMQLRKLVEEGKRNG
jgi:hypothetical protein